jgi:hypothetical protein
MIEFIKKNKFYVAAFVLFTLLYFYGNNMEFYDNVKKCDSKPEKVNNPQHPYLDATDDVVLERRDLRQLHYGPDKIAKFSYNGLDNWDIISDVKKGWWGEHIEAGNGLYKAPKDLIWVD